MTPLSSKSGEWTLAEQEALLLCVSGNPPLDAVRLFNIERDLNDWPTRTYVAYHNMLLKFVEAKLIEKEKVDLYFQTVLLPEHELAVQKRKLSLHAELRKPRSATPTKFVEARQKLMGRTVTNFPRFKVTMDIPSGFKCKHCGINVPGPRNVCPTCADFFGN